ncbi:MAG: tetratricopeptide repeat protein [Pseudooceanicola nanhaiensis]
MIDAWKPMAAALLALTLLAGCKSEEEKAEEFFQSALSYIEAGDIDRAMIEFRNVFDNDGFHKEARLTYAKLLLEQGQTRQAYGQFLRLVEQYPDTVEARAILATLALDTNNWEEVRRHGEAAIALDPDRPDVKAVAAALAYRDARLERDDAAAAEAADMARAALEEDAELLPARRILIDEALSAEDFDGALEQLDAALETAPDRVDFNMLKAQLLGRTGDQQALGAQLKTMYEKFPENQQIGQALITWYMSQQDYDGAEGFLRDRAGPVDGPIEGHLAVVEFLHRARDIDAALAETERLAEATAGTPEADVYGAARASLMFEKGQREDALSEVEAILQDAEPSDQTRRIRIILARMLSSTGNVVGARAEVEKVLEEDPSNVDALKMRAAWLIQGDKPDEAILDLRTALDQSPRDTGILTLMAEAHQRNGSPQLAQERLALAVEVSGNRPEEALRYARFVLQQGRPALAETVLDAARKTAPTNMDVLALLGELYIRDQRWNDVQLLVDTLREIPGERAAAMVGTLESAMLMGQENVDESLARMQQDIEDPAGRDIGALIRVLRTQIATGRLEEARGYLDQLLEENPESLPLKLFDANLDALQGDTSSAEEKYRGLLAENPQIEPAVLQLASLLMSQSRAEEADEVLDQGLAAMPQSRQLRLVKASRLEQTEDIEGAIAIYEELYAENTSDVVVANNLASLLSTWNDNPETIDRAEVISRRLVGSNVPAFQDTLGWIQYLKGNYDAAIRNLEAAAEGLPNDPNVALHLGLAYAAVNRTEDAKAEIERGFGIAGDAELAQRAEAEAVLSSL